MTTEHQDNQWAVTYREDPDGVDGELVGLGVTHLGGMCVCISCVVVWIWERERERDGGVKRSKPEEERERKMGRRKTVGLACG